MGHLSNVNAFNFTLPSVVSRVQLPMVCKARAAKRVALQFLEAPLAVEEFQFGDTSSRERIEVNRGHERQNAQAVSGGLFGFG